MATMEAWELEFEWQRVQHIVKNSLRQDGVPDLNLVLLMIGIQELGRWKKAWTKEEKQDLMHIAVCALLSMKGYFEFTGRDEDGWPHYRQAIELPKMSLDAQETLLKTEAVRYFNALATENGGWGELAPK